MPKAHLYGRDLQGISRLAIEATTQVTNISEGLFATIMRRPNRRIGGIPGLVYRQIHGITRLVGWSLDQLFGALAPANSQRVSSRQRNDLIAALNGVMGDYLVASNNPLQTSMSLRVAGAELEPAAIAAPQSRILLYIHGVCMHEQQLQQQGHDHGLAAAATLGYSPIHVRYNTGLHIAENGQQLSQLLEQLLADWPVPIEELVILGYSMGGLVARSACYYAEQLGHSWSQRLTKLVFWPRRTMAQPLNVMVLGCIICWSAIAIAPYLAKLPVCAALASPIYAMARFCRTRSRRLIALNSLLIAPI